MVLDMRKLHILLGALIAVAASMAVAAATSSVTLTWSAVTTYVPDGSPASGLTYDLYQGATCGSKSRVQTGLTGLSATVSGIANGTMPCFAVTAVSSAGVESAPSNDYVPPIPAASTTPAAPTGLTGTVTADTPPVNPPPDNPPAAANLAVSIVNGKLVDGAGKPLQLRGVLPSDLEFVAIQGWDPASPWGGAEPNWAAIAGWHANAVRIPLNSASWLGLTTYDYNGMARKADPGGNYQATVIQSVKDATAAGLYVILDLHWSAPKLTVTGQSAPVYFSPMGQPPMPNADTDVDFWKSVATQFKGMPNVIFDLFNEPYPNQYGDAPNADPWAVMLNGATMALFPNNTSGGADFNISQAWTSVGYQKLLDTVRATGATNVVMIGTMAYSGDPSQWLTHVPNDPLHQIAMSIHLYPAFGATFGTPQWATTTFGAQMFPDLQAIEAAGYPVIAGEVGDHNAPGTTSAPFLAATLPWADANNVSYIGMGWDVWANTDNILIKDANGTPTDGYGTYFKAHLACAPSCPAGS